MVEIEKIEKALAKLLKKEKIYIHHYDETGDPYYMITDKELEKRDKKNRKKQWSDPYYVR